MNTTLRRGLAGSALTAAAVTVAAAGLIGQSPATAANKSAVGFSNQASSFATWNNDVINYQVCDPANAGRTVSVQLARPGKVFPVVRQQLGKNGCTDFYDLDGAGPLNVNTKYSIKASFGTPNQAWPAAGCFAATGGRGLCDVQWVRSGVMHQLPFPCTQRWGAATYNKHGDGNIDFNLAGPADAGRPVLASASGKIVSNRYETLGGNVVKIQHPDGNVSVYAHLQAKSHLGVGTSVSQGQLIGRVGKSGTGVTGYHLHYELRTSANGSATVRPSFNGVPSPVYREGDQAVMMKSANHC